MSQKSVASESDIVTQSLADTVRPMPLSTSRSKKGRSSREGLMQTVTAAAELLDEGDKVHAGMALDARDLLLNEIEPDPLQPRRHFDEIELRTLADDIARRGILQPILVRPPQEVGGRYRLIAGERRWRAAQLAGKVRIPARIRDMDDREVRGAQLVENVMRADLSDIEKGQALRNLYELRKAEHPKITWEDIAEEVGLGRARIHDLFHLAALPEPVADLIASGRLSGSHGIALQRAMEDLDASVLLTLAQRAARDDTRRTGGYGLSVAQLRKSIQNTLHSVQHFPTPSLPLSDPMELPLPDRVAALSVSIKHPSILKVVEALQRDEVDLEDVQKLLSILQAKIKEKALEARLSI